MRRDEQGSTWPFLVVLAGLFVLSVLAPRDWERIAHRSHETVQSPGSKAQSAFRNPSLSVLLPSRTPVAFPLRPPLMVLLPERSRVVRLARVEPQPKYAARREVPAAHQRLPADGADLIAHRPDRTHNPPPDWSSLKSAGPSADDAAPWPEAETLLDQLGLLACECDASSWAVDTSDWVRRFQHSADRDTQAAAEALQELQRLSQPNHPLLAGILAARTATQAHRARYALQRRLELWKLLPTGTAAPHDDAQWVRSNRQRLGQRLGEFASLAEGQAESEAWRNYLLFDALRALADAPRERETDEERKLVERVLGRLERVAHDRQRRQLILSGPLADLTHELDRWTRKPADFRVLLADVEQFERSGLPRDGRRLAGHVRQLSNSTPEVESRADEWLEANYRNSNLRVAVAARLVNRFLPRQPPLEAPVRDRILGVPTRGWSTTTADLGIRLVPDPHRLRFALEVQGLVNARTTSRSGPATFYSRSDSAYLAYKQFEFGPRGLKTWPSEAEATNSPQLREVETDYDAIPLVGLFVQMIARAKHAEQQGAVRRIVRRRVSARVEEELDSTVEPKVARANAQLREWLLDPLAGLALAPSVIDMHTSAERLTLRLRLAAHEQLAACTPRPRALADSLASIQIHQSLLNNVCERLELDGRTFGLPELQRRLCEAFRLPPETFRDTFPEDMRITFAAEDSVRARFADGRIELTITIDELRKYPKTWRDFQVRVVYKPQVGGLDVRFVRDGTIHLRSERYGSQPQLALRGLFSKIFAQDRSLSLFDSKTIADPRLADLAATQCHITDGWLALALGPPRAPEAAGVGRQASGDRRSTARGR